MATRISFIILVTGLSLGQLGKLYGDPGSFALYASDLSLGLFIIISALKLISSRSKLTLSTTHLFVGLFAISGSIALLFNFVKYDLTELVSPIAYLVRFIMYLLAVIFVSNLFRLKFLTLKDLYFFIYSGIFVAIAGFIQLVVLPDFEVLDPSLGWDPHKNRLASTFFDPNFTGAYLVLCFVLLLWFIHKGIKQHSTLVTSLILGTLLLAIFLTFSRSSWAFLGIFLMLYGLLKNRKVFLVSVVLLILTYYAVPRVQTRLSGITDPADSASFRIESWKGAFKVIDTSPYIGVGFNAYKLVQYELGLLTPDTLSQHSSSGSDSSLLFVWATSGVLGLISYTVALLFPIFNGIKLLINQKYLPPTVFLYAPLLAGIFIESAFINSLFFIPFFVLFFSINDLFAQEFEVSRRI